MPVQAPAGLGAQQNAPDMASRMHLTWPTPALLCSTTPCLTRALRCIGSRGLHSHARFCAFGATRPRVCNSPQGVYNMILRGGVGICHVMSEQLAPGCVWRGIVSICWPLQVANNAAQNTASPTRKVESRLEHAAMLQQRADADAMQPRVGPSRGKAPSQISPLQGSPKERKRKAQVSDRRLR